MEKKLKYKKLYQQEKDKVDRAMAIHAEDMKVKNEEIEKLKKQIRELPNSWELKVRALEVCNLYTNPLPEDKILDWSKLKQIADDILNCI